MKPGHDSKKQNSFWADFCNRWVDLKKEAVKTNSWEFYESFLRMVEKEFTKLYAQLTKPDFVSLVEAVLKTTACELKGIMIKYKREKIPF